MDAHPWPPFCSCELSRYEQCNDQYRNHTRMSRFAVAFVVFSDSSETLHHARDLAERATALDRIHQEVATAANRVKIESYQLRDYFESVSVSQIDDACF